VEYLLYHLSLVVILLLLLAVGWMLNVHRRQQHTSYNPYNLIKRVELSAEYKTKRVKNGVLDGGNEPEPAIVITHHKTYSL